MKPDDLLPRVAAVEYELAGRVFVEVCEFVRNGRRLHVALTDRLRRSARRERLWAARPFMSRLANAQFGFDQAQARSKGGREGIFLLDRSHRPPQCDDAQDLRRVRRRT